MNDFHSGLRVYGDQLHGAIERDLDRRARRPLARRSLRVGLPLLAVAGAAAAIAVTLVASGTRAQPADAAILRHVTAALTAPAGTILHDRATVTVGDQPPQAYELWSQESTGVFRVIKFGHEIGWDGTTYSVYDPASNSITTEKQVRDHSPADIAATLRSLVESGKARVDGTTVLDGVRVYELTIADLPSGWSSGVVNGTYDVAQSDYRPLLIRGTVDCAGGPCGETVRFSAYEYLPATTANLRLLDLAAQHPGARIAGGS